MRKAQKSAHHSLLSFLLVFLSWGCATLPGPREDAEYELEPPPSQKIGQIAWVDPGEKIAVVHLDPRNPGSYRSMASRNDILVETARLERSEVQRGRMLGVRIIEGLPNVGDEVVLE